MEKSQTDNIHNVAGRISATRDLYNIVPFYKSIPVLKPLIEALTHVPLESRVRISFLEYGGNFFLFFSSFAFACEHPVHLLVIQLSTKSIT